MTLSNGEIALVFATFMFVAGATWTIMIVRAMRAEADKLRELAWKASQEHSHELLAELRAIRDTLAELRAIRDTLAELRATRETLAELRAIRETLGDFPSRTIRETLGDIRYKLYNP
jgi:hypothetical protein